MVFIVISALCAVLFLYNELIVSKKGPVFIKDCYGIEQKEKYYKNIDKVSAIILFIALAMIAALRYNTGGSDYFAYQEVFSRTPTLRPFFANFFNLNKVYKLGGMEIGWLLAGSFIKSLGLGYNALLIIHSLFFFTCVYKFFKNFQIPLLLFLLVFIYKLYLYNSMVSLRQSTTIAIFLLIYKYIPQKKLLPYLIGCAVAATFHKASLILLPLYFIGQIKFTKKALITTFFIGFAIFLLSVAGVIDFSFAALKAVNFMTETLGIPYNFNTSYIGSDKLNIMHSLEYSAIMLFIIIFYDEISKTNKNSAIVISMIACLMPVFFIFRDMSIITRFKDYFTIFYAVVLYYAATIQKGKYKTIVYAGTCVICIAGLARYMIYFDNGHFFHYQTILFDKLYLLFSR